MYIELKKDRLIRIDVNEVRDIGFRPDANNTWYFFIQLVDGKVISEHFDTENECLETIDKLKRFAKNYGLIFE